MKQYFRDKSSRTLTISDPEKEKEIMFKRRVEREISALKNEINKLNEKLDQLLATRN